MKKNLLLTFFVGLCLACNSQTAKTENKNESKAESLSLTINGKLNNPVSGKIYLEKMNERNIGNVIDSSAVSANTFAFKTTIPHPGIYQINIPGQQVISLILDGGETLNVTADGLATPEKVANYKIEGSATMDKFNEIITQLQQFGQYRNAMDEKFKAAKSEKDREVIRQQFTKANLEREDLVLSRTKALGTTMAGIIAANNFLDPEINGAYLMELAQKLKDEGKNHFMANLFIQTVARKSIGTIGTPAPDFELSDLSGKKVKLSELKGKTVIIDFWATWCGPCIASFPGMKMAIDKFKDNPDVVFLFVNTLERVDPSQWKSHVSKFVTQRGYGYLNPVIDEGSEIAMVYGVESIPSKFCIDKNGNFKRKSLGYLGSSQAVFNEMVEWVEGK